MKVMCVNNKELEGYITIGRQYAVYSTKMLGENNLFEIKDDKGNQHFVITTRFKNIRRNKVLRIFNKN